VKWFGVSKRGSKVADHDRPLVSKRCSLRIFEACSPQSVEGVGFRMS
jgi:hypothetical protein